MFKHLSKVTAILTGVLISLILGLNPLSAQTRQVRGVVLDKSGEPLPGVSVLVKGTTTGVVTELDGTFAVNAAPSAVLLFSMIGYQELEVAVAGQSQINVTLEEDNLFLDEIVVVGYGTQRKSDLTGSVGSVKAEDLKNQSTTDAAAALQGKLSGVHVINNGAPGEGSEIRVRGYSSNGGNISPLYIVDGLQVSSIQYLDPSLIESIEVLKDAASAAIYGAEAGNGVVLVTTKTGKEGNATVTYNGRGTLQNFTRRPLMNRDEFLTYEKLALGDQFVENNLKDFDYKHPMYPGGVIDTDWISAYVEPTWSQQHSVSFSGGNSQGHFFTSLNYVYNNGVIRGDKDVYNRLSAQINADYNLFKWLKVGTNTTFEKWSTKGVSQRGYASSFDSMITMDPLTPVYWTDPSEFSADFKATYDRVQNGDPTVRPYRFFRDENGWFANTKYTNVEGSALAKRDATDSSNGGININGSFYANLMPIKGLTITSRFGYRINQSVSHSYTAPYYIGPRGSQDNYSINANANTGFYYQWENFANYMRTFGKHTVTAMAGMSYKETNNDNVSASSSGADILSAYEPQFQYLNYVKGDASKTIGNAPSKTASLAYFGRLIYTYDNRYSIQANFRADAFDSSKLPKKNRWGYFPSFSAGWTISNESFFKDNLDSAVFNFLKLRASWGRNGNINVLGGYRYATTISLGNNWYQYGVDHIGSTFASSPNLGNGLPNSNLKWETSEQLDFGLDARFLSNKLTLTVDYFDKKTRDLLFDITIPAELGATTTTINGGTVLNRGLEFEASWRDRIGDFNYGISANFSTLHNEVLSLPEGTPRVIRTDASSTNYPVQTVFEVGYPVWYIRGFQYEGADASGAPIFKDNDGVDGITTDDMVYLGQGTPTFTYGLNINLEYKGFDMLIYGAGVGGNSILPVVFRGAQKNTFKYYLEQYQNGTYPHPSTTEGDWRFWSSDANLFKGDFFRIKQMQFGYTLPSVLTRKIAISNLRFYVSLDDFFTFTSYPGLDPETASTNNTSGAGLDWGSYPTMQKLNIGVNMTF